MDIYNDDEHIISSDEYSEGDNEDSLMNDCIKTSQSIPFQSSVILLKSRKQSEQKNKQVSSLVRSKRMFVIYKKKSIKWLNNQKQREKYKQIIQKYMLNAESLKYENITKIHTNSHNDEISASRQNGVDRISDVTSLLKNSKSIQSIAIGENITTNNSETEINLEQDKTIPCKIHRQSSQECNEKKEGNNQSQKDNEFDSAQFYKKINELFPKYDEYINKHINFITKNATPTATEEKMNEILSEIKTLDNIIYLKEMEWKRLLYLKMTKEEIYSRLSRKKHIVLLEDKKIKIRSEKALTKLRECELFKNGGLTTTNNASNYSIQQLIENRANMKPEDLMLETNNTSRLQSLLVSRDILPNIDSPENNAWRLNIKTPSSNFVSRDIFPNIDFPENNTWRLNMKTPSSNFVPTLNKLFEKKTYHKGSHQEEPTSVNNNNQTNEDILKQNSKLNENTKCSYITKRSRYPFQSSSDDVFITAKLKNLKKETGHELVHDNFMKESSSISLNNSCNILKVARDFRNKSPIANQYPFCQECKTHESRFVCAGCGNQWYCSKICQISAWDKHSDTCPE